MASLRTSDGHGNGDGAFMPTAGLRQRSDALGPRARRTIDKIIEATREVFLTRGYAGTTVDEITRVAAVSRASFYTYFQSKREVLLAVGAHAATESLRVIERLDGSRRTDLTTWVGEYFEFLDVHGSFTFAWTQAAREDEELRIPGMRRHLRICERFGERLAASAGRTHPRPVVLGIVAESAIERSWNYSQLYSDKIDRAEIVEQAAEALWSLARQPALKQRA